MTSGAEPRDELDLARVLRLGWRLLLLGALVGAAGGSLFATVRADRVASTIDVAVKTIVHDVSIDTEARAVTSDAVLGRASQALPEHPTVRSLRRGLHVGAIPGSTVLRITFVSGHGPTSVERVQAVAAAYLADRSEDARRDFQAERPGLEQQLREAMRQLDEASRARTALPGESTAQVTLANQERAILSRINDLQGRLDEVDRYLPVAGSVQRTPSAPAGEGPPPAFLVVGSALVGMVMGLAWATLRARRRVTRPDEADVSAPRPSSRSPLAAVEAVEERAR